MMIFLLSFILLFQNPPLQIGSKSFTESVILGEIVTLSLQEMAIPAEHTKQLGGSRILWNALLKGDLDIYPEYTGTLVREIFSDKTIQNFAELKAELNAQNIEITKPIGFNNTYALGMLKSRARALDIRSITDLKRHPELKLGFSNEFMQRGDGWPGLVSSYGLPHKNVVGLDHDLSYRGLESGSIDIIDIYSTDAEIDYYNLVALADDKSFFPQYDAVVIYRSDISDAAKLILNGLSGKIDEKTMISLNAKVKLEGQSDAQVASEFLNIIYSQPKNEIISRIYVRTAEHLYMVGISLMFAIFIAIPLGVAATFNKVLESVVMNTSGILQTIPSLALLVVMIPIFGIGYTPAIVALFLYSLLPIVRNTHQGIANIRPALVESAEVLGLSESWILGKIKLPLAASSILAGIKTAAVINVGTATLGALIGAGGYGQPILTGIRLDSTALILEGAVPAAVLALLIQGAFEIIEKFWFSVQK